MTKPKSKAKAKQKVQTPAQLIDEMAGKIKFGTKKESQDSLKERMFNIIYVQTHNFSTLFGILARKEEPIDPRKKFEKDQLERLGEVVMLCHPRIGGLVRDLSLPIVSLILGRNVESFELYPNSDHSTPLENVPMYALVRMKDNPDGRLGLIHYYDRMTTKIRTLSWQGDIMTAQVWPLSRKNLETYEIANAEEIWIFIDEIQIKFGRPGIEMLYNSMINFEVLDKFFEKYNI